MRQLHLKSQREPEPRWVTTGRINPTVQALYNMATEMVNPEILSNEEQTSQFNHYLDTVNQNNLWEEPTPDAQTAGWWAIIGWLYLRSWDWVDRPVNDEEKQQIDAWTNNWDRKFIQQVEKFMLPDSQGNTVLKKFRCLLAMQKAMSTNDVKSPITHTSMTKQKYSTQTIIRQTLKRSFEALPNIHLLETDGWNERLFVQDKASEEAYVQAYRDELEQPTDFNLVVERWFKLAYQQGMEVEFLAELLKVAQTKQWRTTNRIYWQDDFSIIEGWAKQDAKKLKATQQVKALMAVMELEQQLPAATQKPKGHLGGKKI